MRVFKIRPGTLQGSIDIPNNRSGTEVLRTACLAIVQYSFKLFFHSSELEMTERYTRNWIATGEVDFRTSINIVQFHASRSVEHPIVLTCTPLLITISAFDYHQIPSLNTRPWKLPNKHGLASLASDFISVFQKCDPQLESEKNILLRILLIDKNVQNEPSVIFRTTIGLSFKKSGNRHSGLETCPEELKARWSWDCSPILETSEVF